MDKSKIIIKKIKSHALRVRGLKLSHKLSAMGEIAVARSTRAWIETMSELVNLAELLSHALRVRGLKL